MPTKPKDIRPGIESGSISEVVLHFLYIYNKSNVYQDPTFDELYDLNPNRYKKKDNLDRALSRMLNAGFIAIADSEKQTYKITDEGILCVNKLAMLRGRKEASKKAKAGILGTNSRWDLD